MAKIKGKINLKVQNKKITKKSNYMNKKQQRLNIILIII